MRSSWLLLFVLASSLSLAGAALAQDAPPQSDLDDLITTYNALPDTPAALAIAPSGVQSTSPSILPHWVRDLPLTRQEAGALVALAGAYRDLPPPPRPNHPRNFTLPEWVAGAAVALKTQSELEKAGLGTPNLDSAPIYTSPRQPPARPAYEALIRNLTALESCPGAFASLALKLHASHPESVLDERARRARTDSIILATKPDVICARQAN